MSKYEIRRKYSMEKKWEKEGKSFEGRVNIHTELCTWTESRSHVFTQEFLQSLFNSDYMVTSHFHGNTCPYSWNYTFIHLSCRYKSFN